MRRSRSPLVLLVFSTLALAVPGAARPAAAEVGEALGAHDACLAGKLEAWGLEASKAYDETTGRDKRNYAPDRVVDYLHMKLEMRFDDLEHMRFEATETLRVQPIGEPVTSITLDVIGLDIESVSLDGGSVEHFAADETVTLRFEPPLAAGREHEIVFAYVGDHPADGMFFTPAATDRTDYPAEVHTQGQTVTNRHWFVSHDSPNERMTTELIVDVPAGLAVSSNGRLVSHTEADGRALWHWLQDKPHVSYLVSLVIGTFDIVEIPHDRVPMRVWVPPGLGENVMQTYGRTGEMCDVLERRFGVPYPWDRYDQLVVKNFGAGGMENTSATTMYPTAILDETALLDGNLDGLIAHELAHQWSGDLLTCKSWAHVWLNEGFATYGSALWYEHRDGEDGYLSAIRRSFGVARRDSTSHEIGMVSPVYERAWETFRRRANPYPKGSSILHMLRMMLGEEVFWAGMHLYMSRHALGTVETNDFRYALEEVSGLGLEWFFDQWCYRPGAPNLAVKVDYDGGRRELLVEIEQTQQIDERTPAFRFTLPLHVGTDAGWQVLDVDVRERTTSYRAVLDGVPEVVAVDPRLHVLCTMEVEKPRAMWLAQGQRGPTVVARQRAVGALGKTDTPEHRMLLATIVADETEHHALRKTAVGALAGYGSDEAKAAIRDLYDAGVAEARVRVDLVEALRDHEADDVTEVLARCADGDPSYATRVAAIRGLAKLKAEDHADLLVELVGFESQHDQVRRAALEALADLDDPRGLDLALEYAAYGYMDRSRPAAISVVGRLADHDRDRAVETLIDLLDDPTRRPARAAGAALARLGDERAVAPLEAMSRTHPSPARREQAERWLETLHKKTKKTPDEPDEPAG